MQLGGHEPDQKQQVLQLLLKKVARAFYSPSHVVVLDEFLSLVSQSPSGKVREADLVERVKLSKAQVSVTMKRFRADQLVEDDVVAEAEKEEDFFGKAIKGRDKKIRPGFNRRKLDEFWRIDIEHLLKAIRYRHSQILEKLNKYSDNGEQTYVCMNPKCVSKGQAISVFELLMGDRDPNDPEFRCRHCFIEKDGKTIYVPLKQSSETAAQAQGKFQWKRDFIQLTSSIMEHVQTLEALLKKEKDALIREDLEKHEPDEKIGMLGESRRAQEEKLRQEGTEQKRGLADLGTTFNEDKVVVKVDRRNAVDKEAKKAKLGPAMPLPWDQNAGSQQVRHVPADPVREAAPEIKEEEHRQEITRVLELQRSSVNDEEEDDGPDVTLSVGGMQLTCKLRDVDQDQLEQMTPAELAAYDELVRQHAF